MDGEKIVGFYGRNYFGEQLDGMVEFGIITAPTELELPAQVYDMPELQNTDGGLAASTTPPAYPWLPTDMSEISRKPITTVRTTPAPCQITSPTRLMTPMILMPRRSLQMKMSSSRRLLPWVLPAWRVKMLRTSTGASHHFMWYMHRFLPQSKT